MYHGSNLIAWGSHRITSIVTNTFKVEYIAGFNTAKHTLWIHRVLSGMLPHQYHIPILQMDKKSALTLANASGPTRRAKYIDLRTHHLQDLVRRGCINILHLNSNILQADAKTKFLPTNKFLRHRAFLSLHTPLRIMPTAVESLHTAASLRLKNRSNFEAPHYL